VSNQVEQLEMKPAIEGSALLSSPVGKIIVVDDEPELKKILVEALSGKNFEVTGCSSGQQALEELRQKEFDLLLTDLMMPEMDGIALLEAALKVDPHLIGIMMTGQGTIQTAVDAMKLGAFDYILKPFRLQTLLPVLTRAINTRRLQMENLQLRETVAIYGLCQTIAFTLDAQTVLSRLADAALQQTDADEVSVLLPTSDGAELYVAAVRGEKRERLLGERIPLEESISSWVARERMPLLLNGEVKDERFVALWPRPDIRSAVSMPMQVANKLVGVINLNVTNRLRPFTLGQMKALSILASTAAAALESASLYGQLQQAEKNYRSIFENAIEGVFQSTPEGRFITVNPSMARILGYESPDEVIATITDIAHQLYVHPESRATASQIQKERGLLHGFEFEAYRKDGEKIWLSVNRRSVRDDNGSEIYREGSIENITERRRVEEMQARRSVHALFRADVSAALAMSRVPLRTTLESCATAMVEHLGAAFARIWTLNREEDVLELQASAGMYTHIDGPHSRVPVGSFKIGKIAQERAAHITNEVQTDPQVSDKEWARREGMVAFAGYPLIVDDQLLGVMALFSRDELPEDTLDALASVADLISQGIERKRAEQALRKTVRSKAESLALLDTILSTAPIGFAFHNRDLVYQRINESLAAINGLSVEQHLGKTLRQVLPEMSKILEPLLQRVIDTGEPIIDLEISGETPADLSHQHHWLVSFYPVRMQEGELLGVGVLVSEITERKRAEEALKQSESQLAEAQRLAHIGSWNWDLQKNVMTWSDEHYRIFGVQRGDIDVNNEDKVFDSIHPEDRALVRRVAAKTTETREPFNFYYRIVRRDGEERIIQSSGSVETDERGKPVRMFGTAQDVTERRRIEQELSQSEERYRDLVENAHDLIYEHDLEGNYTSTNKAGEQITGYSLEESLKLNLKQTVAPEYLEKAQQMFAQTLAGEKVTAYDLEIVAKDGHHLTVEVNTRLVLKDGVPVGVQGIARDITKRKRAEEALRESEARKRAILESSMDCIITMDHEGLVVDWNPAAEKTFGYSQKEIIGKRMAEIIIPGRFREQHKQGVARYLATGKGRVLGQRLELSAERRDGTEFPIELTITRIELNGAPMFTGYLRDITERKKAENRLSAQYAVTRALAESNTISEGASKILQAVCESLGWEYGSLWTVDSSANVLRCSQTWQSLGAEDEFESVSRESVFAPGIGLPGTVWNNSQPLWIADVVEDTNFPRSSIAARVGLHGACAFPIWFRSQILGVVEFLSRSIREPDPDLLAMMVTVGSQIGQFIERKRVEEALSESEEQLRQSQKLEAIGQLAGGVAHDFNNLLTVIGGYSSILLGKLPQDSPYRSNIEEIKKAGDRAGALTRQLLAFSRKQILQPKVLDLNVVVADLEKMVRRLIGEDIDLLAITSPVLGKVKADPGQIEQVLLNLIVNARDAMPKGGKLTIETRNIVLSPDYAQRHATQPGPYVMLAVSDTGCGIDAAIQPRVFEPFFTTKRSGKGTGLGLATVYGIVKQSGGNIWVYSEVGLGSTFKVYLPRVDEITEGEGEVISQSIPQGTEMVLLVEDEEQVRAILQHILEDQGYHVLAASNGEEALSISHDLERDIKLMITDVVMPQMSGRELAERVLAVRPHLPVLFMSGYTDDAIVRHGLLDEKLNFIQKPFDSATVSRKVREVLDSHL
jgi:PAS domain S-box-containing protein